MVDYDGMNYDLRSLIKLTASYLYLTFKISVRTAKLEFVFFSTSVVQEQ